MNIYGNKLLPDVGKLFLVGTKISFTIPKDSDYEEIEINHENIDIMGGVALVDKKFAILINDERPLKARLINKIFSNDDQMGIILNYQAHKTAENTNLYKLMQDWRDWFGDLCKIIQNKILESHE